VFRDPISIASSDAECAAALVESGDALSRQSVQIPSGQGDSSKAPLPERAFGIPGA
jgi:hypothetical protein